MADGPALIHVLVVDDSAVVRQGFAALLRGTPGFAVSVAADPVVAASRMACARPDVILLDLEMPRVDGLAFLRELMRSARPVPVVVCSAHAGPGTQGALAALELGAVDVVPKPELSSAPSARAALPRLARVLRAAAMARVRAAAPAGRPAAFSLAPRRAPGTLENALVLLGASTGGTEALRTILPALPADTPPVVVVQHMPAAFTGPFAARLDALCAMDVHEARDGERVSAGVVLLAPGDRHLRLERRGRHVVATLDGGPPVRHQRPSVDVLFSSAAALGGTRIVAALLTGMGADGADGLLELRRAGAVTLAQDETSSVVFGMPKEAIERGAATEVVPLGAMAAVISAHVDRAVPAAPAPR